MADTTEPSGGTGTLSEGQWTPKYDWEVPGAADRPTMAVNVACALRQEARRLAHHEAISDLASFFPVNHEMHFQAYFDGTGWFAIRLIFDPYLHMLVGPRMEQSDIDYLKRQLASLRTNEPDQIANQLGKEWFAADRFTYVGRFDGSHVSWSDMKHHLTFWLITIVVPAVLRDNERRILRSAPTPPSYNLRDVFSALWVLECEESCIQGTAFAIQDDVIVTCLHVIGIATKAFQFGAPGEKFPITITHRDNDIDLATFTLPVKPVCHLQTGNAEKLVPLDHLLVVGHPNYRVGDSPIVTPGLVAGFRVKSGIRRIITDAPIVAGCSGGPVLDRSGAAVGIAVTGADSFSKARDTEDHGIIPISAIKLLLRT